MITQYKSIEHEPYDNEDQRNLCLECNKPTRDGTFYCDKCFEELEEKGFFEIDDDFE